MAWRRGLSYRNIGAVYVLIVMILACSIWLPSTFPTIATVRQVLNGNAVTCLAALAILVPLCAGVYDLSFAYTMSFSGVIAAHFVTTGMPLAPAMAIAVLAGAGIGAINAFVVVGLGINSFIGTLATGSLIEAFISMVTNDNSITSAKLEGPFSSIGQSTVATFTLPVLFVVVAAIVLAVILGLTTVGRRLYGVGFNQDAARLSGVRTERIRAGGLVVSGAFAAFTGVVLASIVGSGSPTAGTPYLLPAFAAVFLGATQFQRGRFNVPGTVVAILLLGTGQVALALANAPQWASNMFVGAVLIIALAIAASENRTIGQGLRARLRPRTHSA